MDRLTQKHFAERTKYIAARMVKLGWLAADDRVHLSVFRPGDGTRYQIEVYHTGETGTYKDFPRGGHYRTRDFELYLDGLQAAIDEAAQHSRGQ